MPRLQIHQDIKPLSEFRAKAASFIQQVHATQRPIVITHRGRSAAVLVDVREYDRLLEKLELLQEIHQAESEIKEGRGVAHEEARKRILEGLGG